LLPAATGTAERAGGQPGRLPAKWTEQELSAAQALARRLVEVTGRGRSNSAAALTLAGEGLPVPPATVLAGARAYLARLDRDVRRLIGLSPSELIDIASNPDALDGLLERIRLAHPSLTQSVHRRINGHRSEGGADELSVLFIALGAMLGVAPDPADTAALSLTLHAFELHGLVEGVGDPNGPRLLEGGPSEAALAIGRFGLPELPGLLERIPLEAVHPTLLATRELGAILSVVPAELSHHIGGAQSSELLTDSAPLSVVLRLLCWQAIREDSGAEPDITPFKAVVGPRKSS